MACVLPCQHGTGRGIGREGEISAGLAASGGAHGSPRGLRLQDDAVASDAGYGSFVRTDSEAPAARQRPPLTKRLKPRHWTALDYVVGAVFGLILFATIRHSLVAAIEAPYGFVPFRPVSLTWPLVLLLVFAAVMAVAIRRRQPTLMLGVLLVGSVAVTTLTGPENGGVVTYFLPVGYVLYLVAATYEHRRAAARVLIAVFATLVTDTVLLYLTGGGYLGRGGMVEVALCVIIAWFTGYIVRQRRRYALRLQDEAASKAVAEERLRIARELHDVVAHSMSVIAVQAGYGQYVIDTQPADARDALGAIQATSREALDEMRRMLGALRQADETDQREVAARAARDSGSGADAGDPAGDSAGGSADDSAGDAGVAPLSPAPGLADLDRLVSRTASAGVRVDVTRCGQPRDLPASIDLSAYRIVQEALTNVVKHARTSSCRVLIGYGQDELILEVTDNGAGLPAMAGAGVPGNSLALAGGGPVLLAEGSTPGWSAPDVTGSGHGIIGMRERVSLLGGEFSAGPLPGYGFQVSAHIPLPAESA
jgi:signal transduction histidine kinase